MKRKLYPLITFGFMLAIFVSSMALNAQNQATKLDANRSAIPGCECTITITPQTVNLNCNDTWPENLRATVTGEGADCDGLSEEWVSDGRGDVTTVGCTESRDYTFEYTDDCEQVWTETTTVTRTVDTGLPVISSGAISEDLGCNPTVTPPEFTGLDNCEGVFTPDIEDGGKTLTSGDSECTTYSQTWTATYTDACENDAVPVSITYTWKEDLVLPVISTEAISEDLGCNPTVTPPEFTGLDNCDGVFTPDVEDGGKTLTSGDSECTTYSQTWTATYTDACENDAVPVSITYTWKEDLIDPEITCPDDLYLACEDDIPAPGTAAATDNCDADVLVEYLGEVQNGNPPDAYSITRTWSATDNCENSVTYDQVIYVEACEQEGCTYTQGYWKTHSNKGPAPYDPAWGNLGDIDGDGDTEEEDEDFYYSGQTYYEVFWTPVGGNPYYILAHQFIAAHLNFLNGADPSAAQAEFDIAEALFNNLANTPDEIKKLKKEAKKVWTDPAGILDDYNNGDIGPGHCDDEGDRSADELTGIVNTEENVSISAYPNPFMNAVTIEFTMEEDTDVTLEVYNMTGAKVASLYNGDVQANQTYSFNFDGIAHVNQGTFIYVLRAGKTVKMGRLVMMK